MSELFEPMTLDQARAKARDRFKSRWERGEPITGCECETEDSTEAGSRNRVVGVRFIDSGQVFYFDPGSAMLENGDWVVVESSRGKEAAKVVLAPHDISMNRLQGDLKPIVRKLTPADIDKMQHLRGEASSAVRLFAEKIREHGLPMKAISAEYTFDGGQVTLNFSAPERVDFRNLARELGTTLHCRVELRQVGAREEAKLLGGVGKCGRTLCCASWLPVFPEISMNMAKTQDLPPNPSKVSGVCGRLLCCLSYENEQYRKMKAVMPKLAQNVDTPLGPGTVMSMQILKDLVTVKLEHDGNVVVVNAAELGYGSDPVAAEPVPQPVAVAVAVAAPAPAPESAPVRVEPQPASAESPAPTDTPSQRRRRRRRRGGRKSSGSE